MAKTKQTKQTKLARALALLEKSDYRLTRPRKNLLKAVFAQKGPFSAPSLEKYFAQKTETDSFDPVTIYRTLPVFEKLGIIEKCDFSHGKSHYEVSPQLEHDSEDGHSNHHHHHFVCISCHRVESLDFCVVEGQEQLLKKLGYTNLSHRLEFSGNCRSCSR